MTEIPFDCGVILFTNEEEVSRKKTVASTRLASASNAARVDRDDGCDSRSSYFGGLFCGVCSSGRAPVVSGPVMLGIEAADVDPRAAVNHPRDR